MTLVEFECRNQRFALPLRHVRRIVHSALPTPLPGAPDIVHGVISLAGEAVTVIDFFRRVGLPSPAIHTGQQLIIADIAELVLGFVVDSVSGVTHRDPGQALDVPREFATAGFVEGMIRLDDGLCIIIDPEKFLFDAEKALLGDALRKALHDEQ